MVKTPSTLFTLSVQQVARSLCETIDRIRSIDEDASDRAIIFTCEPFSTK